MIGCRSDALSAFRSIRKRRTIPRSGGSGRRSRSWACPKNCCAWVNRQLDARGLIVKRGNLVDATIIAAAVKRPPSEEGQVSKRDPDASFTIKNGETYFGDKAHLAVDEESGIVRQAEMTSADLHDSYRGEAMIQGDEAAYYGDKAGACPWACQRQDPRDSKALRDKLAAQGIDDNIAYKAKRNKPLVNWQKWFNTTASSVRAGVERATATMKRWSACAISVSRATTAICNSSPVR